MGHWLRRLKVELGICLQKGCSSIASKVAIVHSRHTEEGRALNIYAMLVSSSRYVIVANLLARLGAAGAAGAALAKAARARMVVMDESMMPSWRMSR
jgi:hypothetical protein